MARSEDHQHEEPTPRRSKSGPVSHDDLDALKAWVRQEIMLVASGVPEADRLERNP